MINRFLPFTPKRLYPQRPIYYRVYTKTDFDFIESEKGLEWLKSSENDNLYFAVSIGGRRLKKDYLPILGLTYLEWVKQDEAFEEEMANVEKKYILDKMEYSVFCENFKKLEKWDDYVIYKDQKFGISNFKSNFHLEGDCTGEFKPKEEFCILIDKMSGYTLTIFKPELEIFEYKSAFEKIKSFGHIKFYSFDCDKCGKKFFVSN